MRTEEGSGSKKRRRDEGVVKREVERGRKEEKKRGETKLHQKGDLMWYAK